MCNLSNTFGETRTGCNGFNTYTCGTRNTMCGCYPQRMCRDCNGNVWVRIPPRCQYCGFVGTDTTTTENTTTTGNGGITNTCYQNCCNRCTRNLYTGYCGYNN